MVAVVLPAIVHRPDQSLMETASHTHHDLRGGGVYSSIPSIDDDDHDDDTHLTNNGPQ